MSDAPKVSLLEMIRDLDREIALRKSVFPKWVADRKISQATADRRIEVMEAVRERITMLWHLEEISLEMRGDFE